MASRWLKPDRRGGRWAMQNGAWAGRSSRPAAGGIAAYEGLIATRGTTFDTLNTGQKQLMMRSYHVATDSITSLKLAFQNFRLNGGEEIGSGNAMDVIASIEYPTSSGSYVDVTFGGGATGTVPAVPTTGSDTDNSVGVLFSDSATITIPAGAGFYVYHMQTVTAGGIVYNAISTTEHGTGVFDTTNVERCATQNATTWTVTDLKSAAFRGGTAPGNSTTIRACPMAIIGSTTKKTAMLIGDSITFGTSDRKRVDYRHGIFARSFPENTLAFVNCGVGGAQAANWMAKAIGRSKLFPYVRNVCIALGVNDTSASAATILTNVTAITTDAHPVTGEVFHADTKFFLATITPRCTTTDGCTTLANQTATSSTGQKDFNTNIIAAVPSGFDGVFNTRNVLWDSTAYDGKWKVGATARTVTTTGSCTNGSKTVTKTTDANDFTAADLDYGIWLDKGTSGPNPRKGIIHTVDSGTQITNYQNCTNTETGGLTIKLGSLTVDEVHPNFAGYRLVEEAGVVVTTDFYGD